MKQDEAFNAAWLEWWDRLGWSLGEDSPTSTYHIAQRSFDAGWYAGRDWDTEQEQAASRCDILPAEGSLADR